MGQDEKQRLVDAEAELGSANTLQIKELTNTYSKRNIVLTVALVVVVLCIALPLGFVYGLADEDPIVTTDEILVHLRELEKIAAANPKYSRSIINAYNASFDYVKSQLDPEDWVLSEQIFQVPAFELVDEPNITFTTLVEGQKNPHRCFGRTGWQRYETVCDFASVRYGGNTVDITGNVNGKVTITGIPVMVPAPCERESYVTAGVTAGSIAHVILPRTCSALDLVRIAEDVGAAAVILENSGSTGIPGSRIFDSDTWFPEMQRLPNIPTIGIAPQLGSLLRINQQEIQIEANSRIVVATTKNLIADAKFGGRSGDVFMVGAHLDSVPEGPGINDNGSGSATILAIAKKLAKSGRDFKNGVRFGWWGAEEIGLMGSRFYVEGLDNTVNVKPALYANLDMEAAPNAIRGVHNGASVDKLPVKVSNTVKTAALELESLFLAEFDRQGIPTVEQPMTGGSDFLPFLMGDIAAGGLATGAGGIKTDAERKIHGGLANAPLDPCYHARCDTVDNIGVTYLRQMSTAMMNICLRVLEEVEMTNYYAVTEQGEVKYLTASSVRQGLKMANTNGKYCGEQE